MLGRAPADSPRTALTSSIHMPFENGGSTKKAGSASEGASNSFIGPRPDTLAGLLRLIARRVPGEGSWEGSDRQRGSVHFGIGPGAICSLRRLAGSAPGSSEPGSSRSGTANVPEGGRARRICRVAGRARRKLFLQPHPQPSLFIASHTKCPCGRRRRGYAVPPISDKASASPAPALW